MSNKNFLIVIGGATATGKTGLSIQLAQNYDAEILSCDSRQFYKEMTIGTAKPTLEELAAAPHHFIDSLSVDQNYNVGDYERDAIPLLDRLFLKKNIAIVVGGSGLFIRALCEGLDEYPTIPEQVKNEVQDLFDTQGLNALQDELKNSDPEYFYKVDQQNPVRLMRALNVIRTSGKTFTSFQNQKKAERNFYPIYINLKIDREKLYEKINLRVDLMLEAGLVEEARALFPKKENNALQTVGYQELMKYFENKISLEEAIELIKRNSRRYAKRQMTWFRKDEHWREFEANESEKIIQYINDTMSK